VLEVGGPESYLLPINSTAVAGFFDARPIASLVAPPPTLPLNRCNLVKHPRVKWTTPDTLNFRSGLSVYVSPSRRWVQFGRDCRLHTSIGIQSFVYVDIRDDSGQVTSANEIGRASDRAAK
jgi:hypothetical protein